MNFYEPGKPRRGEAMKARRKEKGKRIPVQSFVPAENSARYNQLNELLRRAEESGDMVKQNLIMEEMARLETGV